jgi:ABC-type transport system involved in Fe-S cluster assembly fused permease/ATPase subunit
MVFFCRYNVRYGRVSAPDDEVMEAARVADIHERILSFPEGRASRTIF